MKICATKKAPDPEARGWTGALFWEDATVHGYNGNKKPPAFPNVDVFREIKFPRLVPGVLTSRHQCLRRLASNPPSPRKAREAVAGSGIWLMERELRVIEQPLPDVLAQPPRVRPFK